MQILVFILIAWWLFGGDKKGKKARKSDSYREWEKRRREHYHFLYGDRP